MDYNGDTSDPAIAAIVFVVFALYIALVLVFAAAIYVLTALALMSFFRKVGIKPWIAWVPVYNNWVWLQVGGQAGWLALLSLIPYGGIVTAVFLAIGMYRTGFGFRKDGGFVVLGIFLPWVWLFMLGSRSSVYDPALITAAGYSAPLAGYGSAPTFANNGEPGAPQPEPTAPAA